MTIAFGARFGMSLTLTYVTGLGVPGNTSVSPLVGAGQPLQLPTVLQLVFAAAPVQLQVAAEARRGVPAISDTMSAVMTRMATPSTLVVTPAMRRISGKYFRRVESV